MQFVTTFYRSLWVKKYELQKLPFFLDFCLYLATYGNFRKIKIWLNSTTKMVLVLETQKSTSRTSTNTIMCGKNKINVF